MKIMTWNFKPIIEDLGGMNAAIEFIKGYITLVDTNVTTMFIVDPKTGEIRKVTIINGKLNIKSRE